MRKLHSKKEINKALKEAVSKGFRYEPTRSRSSHVVGRLKCPEASREGCMMSVYGTPRQPGTHAKQIRAFVESCTHGSR